MEKELKQSIRERGNDNQRTLDHLPTFWATQQEVKEALKNEHDRQEAMVIKRMANRKGNASISGQILNYFRINKADIRTILRKLANNRPLQVTLCNLLGAGRFKTINDNCLMRTSCPRCKQPDSWAHHKICYRNNLPTKETRAEEGEDSWIKCLISYLKVIQTDSPAKYTPSGQKYHDAG